MVFVSSAENYACAIRTLRLCNAALRNSPLCDMLTAGVRGPARHAEKPRGRSWGPHRGAEGYHPTGSVEHEIERIDEPACGGALFSNEVEEQKMQEISLQMDSSLIQRYTKTSQKTRVVTETWVGDNMFCPRCGSPHIVHYKNNKPVAGFFARNAGMNTN